MAVQGGCDVRAKECKPCGRQTRVEKQRQEGRRERNLLKEKYQEREREAGSRWQMVKVSQQGGIIINEGESEHACVFWHN